MSNPFFKNYGPLSVSEITECLNIKDDTLNSDQKIEDIKDLFTANNSDITFFHPKKYKDIAKSTKASFCITTETLKKIGLNRINFAFLDAQHTKSAVLQEFKFINKRQIKGDMIFFDDVTPNLFDGVCNAVKEIEIKYPYKIKYFPFDRNRGYALATKI